MEILQKRGALTHFQILGEISKQEPNLKQKDLAERLGITIQAVSENIKTLSVLAFCEVSSSAICSGFPTNLTMNEIFQGVLHTALIFHWAW